MENDKWTRKEKKTNNIRHLDIKIHTKFDHRNVLTVSILRNLSEIDYINSLELK